MKNKCFIIIVLFFFATLETQVGINTSSPTHTLDLNCTLRVRTINSATQTDSPVKHIWRVIKLTSDVGKHCYHCKPQVRWMDS